MKYIALLLLVCGTSSLIGCPTCLGRIKLNDPPFFRSPQTASSSEPVEQSPYTRVNLLNQIPSNTTQLTESSENKEQQ